MNDLPVFIQLFVRTFALLAAGFWMSILGGVAQEEKKEGEAKPAEQKMEAPANPGSANTTGAHAPVRRSGR